MLDEVACTASADDGVLNLGSCASAPLAAGMEDKTLAGRPSRVKNIEQIVAAHGDIYIATASSAYSEDLLRKVRKAKILNRPSFILNNMICPCPPGWEYDPALGIEIARLGVETEIGVSYNSHVIRVRKWQEND